MAALPNLLPQEPAHQGPAGRIVDGRDDGAYDLLPAVSERGVGAASLPSGPIASGTTTARISSSSSMVAPFAPA